MSAARAQPAAPGRQRGITLLEMLVAMTIMALSITIIYRAVGGSMRGVEQVDSTQHAMQLMQSLLEAYPVIDPRQPQDSGQDGALTWVISATPYSAAGQPVPTHEPTGDAVMLYLLSIDIQSPAGRQWQAQTLRPLLRLQGD